MKKFIVFLLIILVVVGAFFVIRKAREETTIEENTEFSVSINGEKLNENSEMMLAYGVEYSFNVSKGFTVEILPNSDVEESNFFFYVDDKPYYFRAETKLLDAFRVYLLPNNTFSLSLSAGANILKILENIYPEQEVRFKDGEDFSDVEAKIFSLVVREKNGNDKVVVNFGLAGMTIELPSEIVF